MIRSNDSGSGQPSVHHDERQSDTTSVVPADCDCATRLSDIRGAGWGVFERRTGDGFMRCSDGHVRWGIYGAAGVVFVVREPDARPDPW